MELRNRFKQYIYEQNIAGSGKASSYVRALDLLDGILGRSGLLGFCDFWSITDDQDIAELYAYALEFQKKEGSVFLAEGLPPSYGRDGWYSAALKNYQAFLVLERYESKLWGLFNNETRRAKALAECIESEDLKGVEKLVEDKDVDFSSKEGKEAVRQVKTRVNQQFFRKMILATYESRCCLCGLNIPDVLRASHIVRWADDRKNRMNPENGLCLSATYDAAFDRYLITFDEDYRLVFSPALQEYCGNEAFKKQFVAYEGMQIKLPERYAPDREFLEMHRAKLVS